jgi:hypothetical protein
MALNTLQEAMLNAHAINIDRQLEMPAVYRTSADCIARGSDIMRDDVDSSCKVSWIGSVETYCGVLPMPCFAYMLVSGSFSSSEACYSPSSSRFSASSFALLLQHASSSPHQMLLMKCRDDQSHSLWD